MVDDVVDVIDEEAEEDLLKMGGVGIDDMHANTVRTARLRARLAGGQSRTAVIASLVIGQFEGAIEKIVALAVLMPIVASMGGNAGTQTVTVAVRALAMGELTAGQCAALHRQGGRRRRPERHHLRPPHGRRRGRSGTTTGGSAR